MNDAFKILKTTRFLAFISPTYLSLLQKLQW